MARGRFVSKEICVDKEVNKLSSPWSMLAFTWLITHADREGRTYGDPSIVKSLVFPRLDDKVTSKDVEGFIEEWHSLGLVVWYEVDGDKFIEFPNFEKHQLGMKKEREPASTIPANSVGKHQEDCRKIAGRLPAEVKLSKDKLSEEEEEVEVEDDDNDYSLTASFTSITKLKVPTDERTLSEWLDCFQRMRDSGVTPEIMSVACKELADKNYKITGPKSIEKACGVIVSRRHITGNNQGGDFSAFVNR
jgi:hypothetical protein